MNHPIAEDRRLPTIQLVHWIANPVDFIYRNLGEEGNLFVAQIGRLSPAVFICHPAGVEEVFKLKHDRIAGVSPNLLPVVGSSSLLTTDEPEHQQRRRLILPHFHGDRIRVYREIMREVALSVARSHRDWGQLRSFAQEITLKVISKIVFAAGSERADRLQTKLAELLQTLTSPVRSSFLLFPFLQKNWGSWSPWGQFLRLRQEVDEIIYEIIRDRRQNFNSDRTDILSLLLSARFEDDTPMSDTEIRDHLITFLIGGRETTASSLAWGFYWAAKYENLREKLLEDIAKHGDSGPYLDAFCKETLRIYTPTLISTPRQVRDRPVRVLDVEFPAGTFLLPCIYGVHHRPDVYPNPYKFDPDRFIRRPYSSSEFFPFGGSNRRCIGDALAMMEMKVVLAAILPQYKMAIDPVDVHPQRFGITISVPDRLQMQWVDRPS